MAPLVVDPCGYLKPHHSVGHCPVPPKDPSTRTRRHRRRGLARTDEMRPAAAVIRGPTSHRHTRSHS